MEETHIIDQGNSENHEIGLNQTAIEYLSSCKSWSKFLGIIGFVFTGFMALATVVLFITGSSAGLDEELFGGAVMVVGLAYLVMTVIYGYVSFSLYKFASNSEEAIYTKDPVDLQEALRSLKNFFLVMGIMTILGLALMVLGFIGGFIGAIV